MLRSRDIPVTFLVRESSFWNGVLPDGESAMLNEHIRAHHIDLRLSTNLKEIKAGSDGRVSSVVIEGSEEEIHCDLVGLTAGVSPNIEFLRGSDIETDKGVLVDRELRTSSEGVFAIGDCAQQREAIGNRRPVEAVWYTGRMMGEAVAQTICGNPTPYRPGHWFNSAKFMDIEYQTYGWVFSQRSRKPYEEQFHWRHPRQWLCITVSFHRETQKFLGINTFGIRMRHEVFDRWLSQEKTVDEVMASLRTANFDPEFYRKYEAEILDAYNKEYGKRLKPARKNSKEIFGLIRP
jgi:pyruvate/2-oxoglutarate dehydrogenase complex dihydrolipoamide dehydrogenase (E3) component